MHTYIHTCIHSYIHAYIHTCHTCIHPSIHPSIQHTYVRTYMHTYIDKDTQVEISVAQWVWTDWRQQLKNAEILIRYLPFWMVGSDSLEGATFASILCLSHLLFVWLFVHVFRFRSLKNHTLIADIGKTLGLLGHSWLCSTVSGRMGQIMPVSKCPIYLSHFKPSSWICVHQQQQVPYLDDCFCFQDSRKKSISESLFHDYPRAN